MNERIDWYMRQHVDAGMAIAAEQDTITAARYMYSKGVPLHVARRVLSKLAL